MAKKSSSAIADKSVLREFGSAVQKLREQQKLTVYDVTGEDMPIKSRQHWQAIESGKKNINLTTVYKVAKTLNVNPSDLF